MIIVAGGSGTRYGGELPKQFVEVNGLPILAHTINAFAHSSIKFNIIVVLPASHMDTWAALCKQLHIAHGHSVTAGGDTRFQSVISGLNMIDEGVVLVHDGARPCVSQALIERVYAEAAAGKCVVPTVPVHESIRQLQGKASHVVDRAKFVMVQTPQGFPAEVLKRAYHQSFSPVFTDCASVAEAAGEKILLVEGEQENVKITVSGDLILAENWLKKAKV